MGVGQLLAAVELVGSLEGATLQLVVDGLHVHEAAVAEVYRDPRTKELLHEHGYVEAIGIEAYDVASIDPLVEATGYLGEGRLVGYILIGDAMHCRSGGGDGDAGVDAACLGLLLAVGMYLEYGDLDDAVTRDLHPRSLQVEDYGRALEL